LCRSRSAAQGGRTHRSALFARGHPRLRDTGRPPAQTSGGARARQCDTRPREPRHRCGRRRRAGLRMCWGGPCRPSRRPRRTMLSYRRLGAPTRTRTLVARNARGKTASGSARALFDRAAEWCPWVDDTPRLGLCEGIDRRASPLEQQLAPSEVMPWLRASQDVAPAGAASASVARDRTPLGRGRTGARGLRDRGRHRPRRARRDPRDDRAELSARPRQADWTDLTLFLARTPPG
jgi:hypothetical protein